MIQNVNKVCVIFKQIQYVKIFHILQKPNEVIMVPADV